MQCTLSSLLKNIADTLRAHAIEGDQVIIAGDELTGLIDTLDYAAETARRLEDGHGALPSAPPTPRAHGTGTSNVTPFPAPPRRRHHSRNRGFSPWRQPPSWNVPGATSSTDDNDNGNGGDAA